MELKGKIIDFLGDSITEGVGVTDRENNRYDNILKRQFGLKATYNYGIGGTRIVFLKYCHNDYFPYRLRQRLR